MSDPKGPISASTGSPAVAPKPVALEFFAGSGLVAEALRPFFSIVWANDICEKKTATYLANHRPPTFHVGSIEHVSGRTLPAAALAWASFPCQDLSLAGNLHGIESARSGLVWQWLRVLVEMPKRPRLLVAENVLGFVSASGGTYYRAVHERLTELGYRVGAVVLDAANWLPQSRPRVFVIAVNSDDTLTDVETRGPTWCHPVAIQRAAALVRSFAWWRIPEPSTAPKTLSSIIDFDAPTDAPGKAKHNLALIPPRHRARMHEAVNGKSTVFPGYKRTRGGKQVLELRFDGIAGCLRTPRGGSSRQVLVLYKKGRFETRLLTVREAARLMGVRDSFRIIGSYNDGYRAMGDAVAVPAVRHLARHLLFPLSRRTENR
ncbi:MAG: DNA cytosine methyltransferase [Planctomycetota bacterium]